jgi:uncharacterized protein YggE
MKNNMDKSVKITLIVAVTVLLAIGIVGFGFYKVANPVNGQVISVDGTSTIKVTPDVVTIHFNAETNGSNAKIAKDANAVIMDELITSLLKLGFDREDIKTEAMNIYPWTEWVNGKTIDKGYKVSHQVTVLLNTSDASLVGDVIDAGVDAGALLSYINFELSDAKQSEYKALALKQAGEDARVKAIAIAEGLGLKVGKKPVSVTTSDYQYTPWNAYSYAGGVARDMMVSEAKLAVSNIVPGDQTVSGYIQVSYEIY